MDTNDSVSVSSHVISFYYLAKRSLSSSSIKITIGSNTREGNSYVLLGFAIGLLAASGFALIFGLFKLARFWFCSRPVQSQPEGSMKQCSEILDKSPIGLYDSRQAKFKQTICSVCLESFAEGCTVRTLICSHVFHKPCIEQWIKRKASQKIKCPVCNVNLVGDGADGSSIGINRTESNQV